MAFINVALKTGDDEFLSIASCELKIVAAPVFSKTEAATVSVGKSVVAPAFKVASAGCVVMIIVSAGPIVNVATFETAGTNCAPRIIPLTLA